MQGTVLLADKLQTLREPLAAALLERGLQVLHASSRARALTLAGRADVVLLDVNLTEERALDVIRDLRAQEETRTTPIIVHTPREDEHYRREAVEAGAQAVMKRPFDYDALVAQVQDLCGSETARIGRGPLQERSEQQVVAFLARLVEQRVPGIRPEYDPDAALGYAYPPVEEFFDLTGQQTVGLLEDLVAEGLLDRRLVDKVHLCPSCAWHTLNFVEACPRCGDLDIEIEEVIHHFACAHVGPWSEFKQGVDLVCPKCDERLRHMGLDYEKPSDTYVCRQCRHTFNESSVEAHCFHCGHVTPASEMTARRVYAYTPNAKTNRAVEYGRLYGLDIHSVLFEDRSRTFRRDYLVFELDREIYRARRYDSPLSLVLLKIEGLGGEEGESDASAVAHIGTQILERVADELRDLDIVSALDDGLGAILLPETGLSPATQVAERVSEVIAEFQSVNMEARVSVTAAVAELKDEHQEGMEFFDYAHRVLLWALKERSGQIVRADVWEGEVEHA